MQSVELLFNADLDAAVRSEWDRLASAGLPSQSHHKGPTNAPHVTLGVASFISPSVDSALAHAVVALPLPIRLGALTVFGRPGRLILVRLVVPSLSLLTLQAAVSSVLSTSPGADPSHLTPDHWTPHVTLARGLTAADLTTATTLLTPTPDLTGVTPHARRWDSDARRTWLL